ncbi:MAG: hypothetical protein JSV94_05030, partial [Methanobacteriota archaeon]
MNLVKRGLAGTVAIVTVLSTIMMSSTNSEAEAADKIAYEYYVVGNPEDVVTTTSPGLLLAGGSNDIADAMRWMIERSGGGDFVVIRCSGSDGYNPWIYNRLGGVDSCESIVFLSQKACHDEFV